MTEDTVPENSQEKVPRNWKYFPNAIRFTAWEIAKTSNEFRDGHHREAIELFKRLMIVMRGNIALLENARSETQLQEAMVRVRPLMLDCIRATAQHGWIDFPLTGKEPYSDGTFPEKEEYEDDENEEDTVGKEEGTVEENDVVVNKAIKEEIEDEEIPILVPAPHKKKAVKKEEEVELTTRDYSRYFDAAANFTINGTNFTANEKGSIKRAIIDILFKGFSLTDASTKHSVAKQRLVAFSTKLKETCRGMKIMEENGGGPSTSSGDPPLSPLKPPSNASYEEKMTYIEEELNNIVASSTLHLRAKELLAKAVRLVVCDGHSISSASAHIGIAASTMFPYVTKARTQLAEYIRSELLPKPDKAIEPFNWVGCPEIGGGDEGIKIEMGGGAIIEKEEGRKKAIRGQQGTIDEITFVVNEVLDMARHLNKMRREKIYQILVTILTGKIAPTEACNKANFPISSIASFLARARSRLNGRLPPQKTDPKPPPKEEEEETYPYEKGTVVLNGHRLPQSMHDIYKMIGDGELSHIESLPFTGTREELKTKFFGIISRFRYQPHHLRLPKALLEVLVDHLGVNDAADKFDLPPFTVGGWSRVMRMLYDVNELTIVEEDGTRRMIPPKAYYETGKRGKRQRKTEQSSDDEEDEEGAEEEDEES